jgi:hypothetical protein
MNQAREVNPTIYLRYMSLCFGKFLELVKFIEDQKTVTFNVKPLVRQLRASFKDYSKEYLALEEADLRSMYDLEESALVSQSVSLYLS